MMAAAAGCASLAGGLLIAPLAAADDPLAPIKQRVQAARQQSACIELTYSPGLEAIAQAAVRDQSRPAYNGMTKVATGAGDPEAAAINAAMNLGGGRAAAGNCDYTEYGVGFIRDGDEEVDSVGIVFGIPTKAAPPPPPPVAVPPPAPGGGGPAVGPHFPDPPTDAIRVEFDKGIAWTVNVTNSADLPGQCTFVSKNPALPGTNKSFTIDRKGTARFTVLAPPPFSTYQVTVSCHGTFNGKDVEFGHVEQEVSA